jgi:hypothetical protein
MERELEPTREDILRSMSSSVFFMSVNDVRSLFTKKKLTDVNASPQEKYDIVQGLVEHARLAHRRDEDVQKYEPRFERILTILVRKGWVKDDTFTEEEKTVMRALYPRFDAIIPAL